MRKCLPWLRSRCDQAIPESASWEHRLPEVTRHSYVLYRSFGSIDKDVRKHELVAVEYGKDINEVTDALIKAAANDLAGMPEYEHFETAAFAPEPIKDFRRVKRYQYEMMGIVYPQYAEKNILIEYGITEADK